MARKPKDALNDLMGLAIPPKTDYMALAKRLRSYCGGKFGHAKPDQWNARVLGTSGTERVKAA